jgi:hypothetical protein
MMPDEGVELSVTVKLRLEVFLKEYGDQLVSCIVLLTVILWFVTQACLYPSCSGVKFSFVP